MTFVGELIRDGVRSRRADRHEAHEAARIKDERHQASIEEKIDELGRKIENVRYDTADKIAGIEGLLVGKGIAADRRREPPL